jgi:hypothetical protein|eukprot:2828675-Prymnesium_polylepis.1
MLYTAVPNATVIVKPHAFIWDFAGYGTFTGSEVGCDIDTFLLDANGSAVSELINTTGGGGVVEFSIRLNMSACKVPEVCSRPSPSSTRTSCPPSLCLTYNFDAADELGCFSDWETYVKAQWWWMDPNLFGAFPDSTQLTGVGTGTHFS